MRRPCSLRSIRKLRIWRLSRSTRRAVGEVGVETLVAGGALALAQLGGGGRLGLGGVVCVAAVDAQRAAVGGELLDVEQAQAVGLEDAGDGEEGEVGEVLVVDRVPLVVGHEAHQVRELHRDDAAGLEQDLHAGDEVVEVGHVGEHVVAEQQVGGGLAGERARRSPRRRTRRASGCPSGGPPRRRWRRARCRAPGCRARGSTAAGSRRWRRSRRRGSSRRGRSARSSARRSASSAPASWRSRTRSRRSRRRCARGSRTAPAARGSTRAHTSARRG